MTRTNVQIAALAFTLIVSAQMHAQSIRATITGGDGDGKCTFEVLVDGAADIEISGDRGIIRQLSGQPAQWRRLICNQPLPNNPGQFHFKGIDGRGSQQLVRDPNSSGGVAVIRIEDPKGGAEGYTGDIEWRGGSNNFGYSGGIGNWETGRMPNGNWNGAISNRDALNICRTQVMESRNVPANRVTVRRGRVEPDGDSRVDFSFRNAKGVTKDGFCNVSSTGQLVQFQLEGGRNGTRTSWAQALTLCQDEASRNWGVSPGDVRVQHGLDPGNGSYLVNYQAMDRNQRIRTGTCRISATGDMDQFRRQ